MAEEIKHILMFPGQSSRTDDMISRLESVNANTNDILDCASTILGWNCKAQYVPENREQFSTNRFIQVGVFLANHLWLDWLFQRNLDTPISLGLSLGEYNHLVHIGALSFESALKLVEARGRAYDAGPNGMMTAVFPISIEELQEVIERAQAHGIVEIANLNSLSQHVIAGERAAVESAMALIEEEYSSNCVIIENNIPMHSSLFQPVAEAFRFFLEAADWQDVARPYLANVTASLNYNPHPKDFIDSLYRHVFSPVYWQKSIAAVASLFPEASFIETGPGSVLSNLMKRDLERQTVRLDEAQWQGSVQIQG